MRTLRLWLESNSDWAIFGLRLFVGMRLIYGVMDNVLSWEHMLEFRHFLAQFNFPFPLVCAIASVYLQLLSGVCLILGFQVRSAAIVMILNFLIALVTVHSSDSFEGMTPALAILFSCIVFLFQGPGRVSLDIWIQNKS